MDIFNGFQINNPDGVLNENFDDWQKPFSSETSSAANESSSRQRETTVSEEIVGSDRAANTGRGAGQNGANARNSSGAVSARSTPTLSTTSVIGGGIGALTGALASTALAAALVITMFISALTINLSLIMADVDKLIVQVAMSGAQEEDFETPIVAVLDGKNGKHIEQQVYADTLFLTFDGLSPDEEYSICVKSGGKTFDTKTFFTASTHVDRGSVTAIAEGKNVKVLAQNVVLEEREFYSVKVRDSKGNTVFGDDSQEPDRVFEFTLTELSDLYITLDIGGKVFSTCTLSPEPWFSYDFENPAWTWTDDNRASVSFRDTYGGDPLVLPANVSSDITVSPGCYTDGELTYTATASYKGAVYSDVKTETLSALGHEYGEPTFTWTETADGYTASAEFTCIRDFYTETVTADVVSVVTAPTSKKDGYTTYTANAIFENRTYTDEKVVVDEGSALGYTYGYPVFTWTETSGGYSVTAVFTSDGNEHTETVTAEVVPVVTPPTCEKDGYTTYTATAVFEDKQYTDEKVVMSEGSALGHEYGEPTFTWAETSDGYAVTAEFTCSCSDYTETVTAEVVPVVTPPTENKDGYTTYTATVVFDNETYTDEKVVVDEGSAVGYTYGDPVFTWTKTSDGYTVTAKFTANSGDHTETVTAEVVPVVTPPTCEKDGYTTYTATVTFENKTHTDEKVVVNEKSALGHDYSQYYEGSDVQPEFTWTETADGYTAKAKFTCSQNDHTETVTAEVVPVVTPPTCEEDGYTTYTATVVFENVQYSDEKVVVNEKSALGHDYSQYYEGSDVKPEFTWTETADGYTAKATFTCSQNDNTETVTAEVVPAVTPPTCEEDGYTTYTAIVVFENVQYSDEKVVVNEKSALGHDYSQYYEGSDVKPEFTWTETADGYTAKAKFTCSQNDNTETVTAEVVPVVTPPTCEEDGYTTYTATVSFDNKTFIDKKVIVDEKTAIGHDYSQYYEGSNYQPDFIWTADSDGGYTAKAVFYCNNDNTHTKEITAEIGFEDGVDCLEGGKIYYYASVTFNNCDYYDTKEVEVEPGHNLIPVFHWTIMEEGYSVEFYMVCTREDYQEGPFDVTVNVTEGNGYTLYTASVVYDETEYTDQKKVLKTTKSVAVGDVFKPGETMDLGGTVYFTDGFGDASLTSVTGPVTIGSVGVAEGTEITYDAVAIYNNQFVRSGGSGAVVSETSEWLFAQGDGMLVGVKIESGSGMENDPYVLTPVYGEKVTFDANDGVFNVADGYSVTQYYTDEEIEGGVYAIPIPENPESSGKLFLGWYTDPDATQKFDFDNTPITESITLYAGWIRV